ncbi:NAD(P)H-dependent oxidoreductase [Streptomyces sp. MS1.AVA.1]|uniref:NAD(P)H-dependent oxidoreductase n=1 Tax=Streptomyces machairae TaxID=3134109 RepID=A0ABU8UI94_9ACTN
MAENERLRLAIIIGSIRKGRFGHVAAEWLASRARLRHDFDVDVIDLATAWLPDVMSADPLAPRPQAVKDLAPWLAAADAFVVVTPEHNQTFPASLKNAIDWYDEEWHAKPVGFLSYGGPSSGLCAVAALRQVFGEVHSVTVHETVSFHNYWERLGRTAPSPPATTGTCRPGRCSTASAGGPVCCTGPGPSAGTTYPG